MWRRGRVCLRKRICLLCAALWWAASSPASPAEGCWGAHVKPQHATPGQTRRFFQRRSLLFQGSGSVQQRQYSSSCVSSHWRAVPVCTRKRASTSAETLFHYHFGSEWRKQDGWRWWKRDHRCARVLSHQLQPCLHRLWCQVTAAVVSEQSKTKCHFSQHY